MKLLLDPHGDDAVLFAAYTCIAERPLVVVPYRTVPRKEISAAMEILGCSWIEGRTFWEKPELLIYPASAEMGHAEHNTVAAFGDKFDDVPKMQYMTYAPRGARQNGGTEVIPPAGAVAKKLRALSCYESQIEQASTRPWFYDLLDMREWLA